MANNLDTLALVLGQAADIYYKSKSLDIIEADKRLAQTNLEIDRELLREREDKNLAIKVIDSQMTRAYSDLKALNSQIDKLNIDYTSKTGEILSLPDINKTSAATEIQETMHEGSIGQYRNELENVRNLIRDKESEKSSYVERLSAIDRMRADIAGGGAGYAGGKDPEMYDPQDFSYQEYIERSGAMDEPWLKKAYVPPTPDALAKLNKSIVDIEYKQNVMGLRGGASKDSANEKAYKKLYIQGSNRISPLTQYRAQSSKVTSYTEEEKADQTQSYMSDKALLDDLRADLAASFDPVSYNRIIASLTQQGLSLDAVYSYNQNPGMFEKRPKNMTENQYRSLKTMAPNVAKALESIYIEGYNAVEQLKGSAGISGSAEDLLNLSKKRVVDYNSLRKEGLINEADKLAFDFELVTGIDVSNQSDIDELQLKVDNEGFVGISDNTLTNIITDSKDTEFFQDSSDFIVLKSLVRSGDKEMVQSMIKQFVLKWGKAEVLDAFGGIDE